MGPLAGRRGGLPQPGGRRVHRGRGWRLRQQYPDQPPSLPALCRQRAGGGVERPGLRVGRHDPGAGDRRHPGDGLDAADGVLRRSGDPALGAGQRGLPTGHAHGRHAHAHDVGSRRGPRLDGRGGAPAAAGPGRQPRSHVAGRPARDPVNGSGRPTTLQDRVSWR